VFQPNSAGNPIKVALIDDHFLIHESVQHKLDGHPDFELVAKGTAGEQLEPILETHHPDVVLIDLGIPAKVGTTIREGGRFQVLPAIRRLKQAHESVQFLILSGEMNSALVEGALSVGARGYLLKDDELSVELPDAIRAISKGGVYFSREVHRQLLVEKPARGTRGLTDRQLTVLLSVFQNPNLSYRAHANNLGIAENTFDNHLKNIFKELGANNLAAAIVKALQAGLIPEDLLRKQATEET
jgi:two-component system, NarL family, response regulator DegU